MCMWREPGAGASQESKWCPQESPSWVCQVGSTPEEWSSTIPSCHLPETPRPAHKQAHCGLGVGWGKPASPHATPDPPELAPVPAVGSCRRRNRPSSLLVLGLPPEATGPINSQVHMKQDHTAPMFFTLVELCSGLGLSFITEMKKMGMFAWPATCCQYKFVFNFLLSAGFSSKAQNERKCTFSPWMQIKWHPLALLMPVTRWTGKEDNCRSTPPEHGSVAYLLISALKSASW